MRRWSAVARSGSEVPTFTANLSLTTRGDKQSITIKSQDAQAEIQGATINLQRARLSFVILPKRKLVTFYAGLLPSTNLLLRNK
jgi:hypothetical protein